MKKWLSLILVFVCFISCKTEDDSALYIPEEETTVAYTVPSVNCTTQAYHRSNPNGTYTLYRDYILVVSGNDLQHFGYECPVGFKVVEKTLTRHIYKTSFTKQTGSIQGPFYSVETQTQGLGKGTFEYTRMVKQSLYQID